MECLSIKQFKFVDCQALKYNEVCEKQTECKNELKYKLRIKDISLVI